ncbi:nucleotidyltransferase family protein [Candidatus Bathyarchaeota archaeon]|nr:nucleotidyltransferase family protein [Candidatus Bathyarchaeota archaeon]
MIDTGLILAAGRGTRMAPYSDAVAKELLPIGERPVIEYSIRYMCEAGIKRVYVVLGEGKEQIVEYLKDGRRLGIHVAYLFQDLKAGMGTAKAVETAKPWIHGSFVVFYGDSFFYPGDFLREMLQFHGRLGSQVTMGVYRVKSPLGFGIVRMGPGDKIMDVIEGPTLEVAEGLRIDGEYLANSGPLIFTSKVFEYIEKTGPSPKGEYWITETIRLMVEDGLGVYGFRIPREVFWRDVGTPRARLEAEEFALRTFALGEFGSLKDPLVRRP